MLPIPYCLTIALRDTFDQIIFKCLYFKIFEKGLALYLLRFYNLFGNFFNLVIIIYITRKRQNLYNPLHIFFEGSQSTLILHFACSKSISLTKNAVLRVFSNNHLRNTF
ncbi:hypothetical protein BpHYR1_041367 [Brachionus plicatilis]|uniref:Uncharacterized protein n=1 Tax=Brachionus plicatilis TaxID=10195 RepID=A0A3M7SKY1_BRAPC|nr:hypothetical protein BpHYR1_041367 [Brachionus plicatilis]